MFNRSFVVLTVVIVCTAIQLTVTAGLLLNLFDSTAGYSDLLLPEHAAMVKPKWDIWLYLIFIGITVTGLTLAWRWAAERVSLAAGSKGAWAYAATELILTFLVICAAYKRIIYDNSPILAQICLITLLVMTLLIKLLWKEIRAAGMALMRIRPPRWVQHMCALLLVVLFVYMPDIQKVLAMIFIGEQFHHFDFFLMSPGWAYLNGHLPYVDAISQYGVGVVAIYSRLAAVFGGFDYEPVLRMFMVVGIAYYILLYAFTRFWLGSIVLSLAVFFTAFRLQMFHYGVSPLSWIYPSTTPVRFGLDILWMALLLAHARTRHIAFLLLAGVYSGFALFYMTATGMCIVAAFYFYIIFLMAVPHLRQEYFPSRQAIVAGALSLVIAPLCTIFLLWLTLGPHVFTQAFWTNMIEYIVFFAHGHAGGVLPMHESLKYRHFWVAVMAFAIPLFYLGTLLSIGGLVFVRSIRPVHVFAMVLAVYGLANYQYFVVRSALTSYYLNAVPLVLLSAFWLDIVLRRLDQSWQLRVRWMTLALSLYALTTNHNYISYPNLLNFSKNPLVDSTVAQRFPDRQGYFNHMVKGMKEEDKLPINSLGDKDEDIRTEDNFSSDRELTRYFQSEFDFKDDAALIASLTKPAQAVALLSSFETKILMQANRPPLFYHLPMITSQPMRMRAYPADAAHSPKYTADAIRQIETMKPEFIFMQKVFLQDKLPPSYAEAHANLIAILKVIRNNYRPYQSGRYLVAMKRINNHSSR